MLSLKGAGMFCGIFMIGLIIFTGVCFVAHAKAYLLTERAPYFNSITLEELDDLEKRKLTGLVYVERDSCVLCNEARPRLEEYLEEEYSTMLHYDTSLDREKDYDVMMEVLEKYHVNSVPAVVVLEKGSVIDTLTYAEIMDGTVLNYITS